MWNFCTTVNQKKAKSKQGPRSGNRIPTKQKFAENFLSEKNQIKKGITLSKRMPPKPTSTESSTLKQSMTQKNKIQIPKAKPLKSVKILKTGVDNEALDAKTDSVNGSKVRTNLLDFTDEELRELGSSEPKEPTSAAIGDRKESITLSKPGEKMDELKSEILNNFNQGHLVELYNASDPIKQQKLNSQLELLELDLIDLVNLLKSAFLDLFCQIFISQKFH